MKTITQIHSIAVVGAGTMGAGIAQLAAQAGYETILYDVSATAVRKGITGITNNLA
ncbi:MAG: 3-hydroxyacyl-CoA dehydrogenase NAD-binding domain-containing protein, partial [Chitinophagales bacterium]